MQARVIRFSPHAMLPYSQHDPTALPKFARNFSITCLIPLNPNAEVEAEVDVVKGRRAKRLDENRTVG